MQDKRDGNRAGHRLGRLSRSWWKFGLELVLSTVNATCVRVHVVTDGSAKHPDVLYLQQTYPFLAFKVSNLPARVSIYRSVYPSIHPSPSVCLSVRLSADPEGRYTSAKIRSKSRCLLAAHQVHAGSQVEHMTLTALAQAHVLIAGTTVASRLAAVLSRGSWRTNFCEPRVALCCLVIFRVRHHRVSLGVETRRAY